MVKNFLVNYLPRKKFEYKFNTNTYFLDMLLFHNPDIVTKN
jgi:hypothetical protein